MEDGANFWMFAIMAGVVIGSIVVYFLIAAFFPEWVGITGKVALDAERAHREGSEVPEEDFASGTRTYRTQDKKD